MNKRKRFFTVPAEKDIKCAFCFRRGSYLRLWRGRRICDACYQTVPPNLTNRRRRV